VHLKSTQYLWTTKNWAYEKTGKIFQNDAKLPQEIPKKQNTLFLNTPKWISISGPSHLAHAKKEIAPKKH
jgi:hypothetical protein